MWFLIGIFCAWIWLCDMKFVYQLLAKDEKIKKDAKKSLVWLHTFELPRFRDSE